MMLLNLLRGRSWKLFVRRVVVVTIVFSAVLSKFVHVYGPEDKFLLCF